MRIFPAPFSDRLSIPVTGSKITLMVTMARIQDVREEILGIAEEYGAGQVRPFGSVARGETDQTSDLDVPVRMDPDRSLVDRIPMIHKLQDLLQVSVDVVNERALHQAIRSEALTEAISL